jgi:hypothetical protein
LVYGVLGITLLILQDFWFVELPLKKKKDNKRKEDLEMARKRMNMLLENQNKDLQGKRNPELINSDITSPIFRIDMKRNFVGILSCVSVGGVTTDISSVMKILATCAEQ